MHHITATLVALAALGLYGCSSADPRGRDMSGAQSGGTDAAAQQEPVAEPEEPGEGQGPSSDGGVVSDGSDSGGAPRSGIVHVAVGENRACRVRADGRVECWGVNYGDLGVPPTARCWTGGVIEKLDDTPSFFPPCTPEPTLIPGLTDIVEVSIGAWMCARRRDNQVLCWGLHSGELGFEPVASCRPLHEGESVQRCTKTPTVIPAFAGAVELKSSPMRTCARRGDGTVACFGLNYVGELGVAPTMTCRDVTCSPPTTIPGLTDVAELAVGSDHTCVRLTDGTARCWGMNGAGQLGLTSSEVCTVFGESTPCSRKPTEVPGLSGIRTVAAGGGHTCAIDALARLRCWGSNEDEQLGDGTHAARSEPRVVEGVGGASSVFLGSAHTCARSLDGTIRCWGSNDFNELGFSSPQCWWAGEEEVEGACEPRPRVVPSMTGAVAIALTRPYACYLFATGELRCIGDIIGTSFGV